MRRLLIPLAILLPLGGLAAPGWIGVQAEQRYQELLGRLQQQGLALVGQTYRRGWFRAEARSELAYRPAGPSGAAATRIELHSQIHHGPWTSRGGWLLALLETRVRVDATPLSAPLLTRIGLSGRGNTRLAPSAVRLDGGGPGLAGLEGEFGFDILGGLAAGWLQIAELAWPGSGAAVVKHLRMDWRLRQGPEGGPLGELELRLERLGVPAGAVQQPLELAGLALRLGLQPRGDLILLELDAELRALDLGAAHYGPARARLYVDNLEPRALWALPAALAAGFDPGTTAQRAGGRRAGALARLAPELLSRDPEIVLKSLRLTVPSGSVEASLRLQARGLRWPVNGAQALQGLQGQAELRLPELLARSLVEARTRERLRVVRARRVAAGEVQAPLDPQSFERQLEAVVDLQFKALLNQGLLEPQGEQLTARLQLENGSLRVNGKALPLALALR